MCACFPCKRAAQGWICAEKTTGSHFLDELCIKDYMHIPQKLWLWYFEVTALMLLLLSLSTWAEAVPSHLGVVQFRVAFISGGLFQDTVPVLLCLVLWVGTWSFWDLLKERVFHCLSLMRHDPLEEECFLGFFSLPSELRIHLASLGWVFGSLCIRNPKKWEGEA